MQIVPTSEKVLLTSGNIDIPFVDGVQIVSLTGSPAVNGSLVVRLDPSATPVIGTTVIFSYEGAATQGGGGTITVMSATPNIAEAWWTKKLNIHSVYTASGWVTKVFVSASESGWIENTDLINASIALGKLVNLTSATLILGNASNIPTETAISGVISISNTGVVTFTAGSIVNVDISAAAAIAFSKLAALSSGNILVGSAGNVATSVAMSGHVFISNTGVTTIQAGVITPSMLAGNGAKEAITMGVSAQSGELANYAWVAPFAGTLTNIYTYVTLAVAATDDWTLTANIKGVPVTGGVVTIAASSALNTADSATPSAANTFAAGDIITFVSAKPTAGGKAQLTAHVTRT